MHSYNDLLLAYETLLRRYMNVRFVKLPTGWTKEYTNKIKTEWLQWAINQCDRFGINSALYQDELKKIQGKPKIQEEAE